MSRAALWKQESNVREREQRADEIFQQAIAEGKERQRRAGVLPLWGPPDSFHFNSLLLKNTIKSPYFQKCCQNFNDWTSVIDEIFYEVKHLKPFSQDRTPSTAFCLLLRLLTLRMTEHQMNLTLNHADSPYIRAIGFLYLRYAGPQDRIYEFIRPYFQDDEDITIEPGHRGRPVPMGEFVRRLFSERDFYGTPLPRLPLQVEREIQVKILQADKIAERALCHHKNEQRMRAFQKLGTKVMALYEDDENPLQWYAGVVDRVITRDEVAGISYKFPRFVVTFTEYGNTETVLLGEMDELDGQWRDEGRAVNRSSDNGRGYRDRDSSHNDNHLYQQVRQRERDTVTADKRWARKPSSQRFNSGEPYRGRSVQDTADQKHQTQRRPPAVEQAQPAKAEPRKRSAEEEAALAEKRRKLISRYS